MTRRTAYYWKCDEPTALSTVPFDEQNDGSTDDWTACATEIARDVFGDSLLTVEPGPSHNRHLTYLLHCDGATYFLRSDVSGVPDDYMLAESHLMELLRARGVPVPAVLATDVSRSRWPLIYQICEWVPYSSLHLYDQRNELDRVAIAEQLGASLATVHDVTAPGYGYVDTQALAETEVMRGLDASYTDYFTRRLEDHLDELAASGLMPLKEVDAICDLIHRHLPLTQLAQGCVVHRDVAFWNVLGEPQCVRAIIDWEDAVLGDPADDVGVFNCFYDQTTVQALLRGYTRDRTLADEFLPRVWLHTLRNMVWKAALRHRMNYFDTANGAFILSRENTVCLRTFTLERIREAVRFLQEEGL